MDPLTSAKSYATLHHVIRKGQMYGVLPYTHHLDAVEKTLREFGWVVPELLVAAWLHDIVEDTDVKIRDVEENFGEGVSQLVAAVTSESGPNRKTRNALTYPKIRNAGMMATALKLADRIANVRNGGSSVPMYAQEHADFRHGLAAYLGADHHPRIALMWAVLDHLLGWEEK